MTASDLFTVRTLQGLRAGARPSTEQRSSAEKWLALLGAGRLADERKNYLKFANILLAGVLGYPADDMVFESDHVEFQYRGIGGGSGNGGNRAVICFEVKGTATADLFAPQRRAKAEHYTPIKQLWDYMGSTGANYGMCSNYRQFVLLTRETGTQAHYAFDFESIRNDPAMLAEFIGVFSRDAIEGGIVESARDEAASEEKELTGEYYDLYGRTRLMLIKEFETCGTARAEAVAAAQVLLNRLIFIFFVADSDMVSEKALFADDVTGILHGRLRQGSTRVWKYIRDELFAWFDRGSNDPRIAAFNGGLFGEPIDTRLSFPDRRSNDFFGERVPRPERQSWKFRPEIEKAVRRHGDLSPIVKNLLALASYDYASQIRVNILGHIFEHSLADLEELAGGRAHRRKREGVFYTPDYITRYICRRTIIPYLSRSGRAEDPADLVAEYAGDLGSLKGRLARIRILDPACGSGAFLTAAATMLLEVHQEIKRHGVASASATLDPSIDDARIRSIVRDNIYGIDVNAQSVEITRLSLFLLTASRNESLPDLSHNIVAGDSVAGGGEGGLDWAQVFPQVFTGDDQGFSVIIGNPPYVRHEDMAVPKEGLGTCPARPAGLPPLSPAGGLASPPPRTSDLSCYFYYRSLTYLAGGGRLGFISSDGWMHSDYGLALQRAILSNTEIVGIAVPLFKVFEDADINTAVVLLMRTALPEAAANVELSTMRDRRAFAAARPDWMSNVEQGAIEAGNWNALFQPPPLNRPRP